MELKPEEDVALPRDTSASSSSPSAFGRYRVVHQVGAGVLGPVFRGYDPQDDRAVAIKAFPLDLTPEQAGEFAADLGRLPTLPLGHASIIAPLGAGADGATAYLVEEYFVAESADVALKQYGPAPVPDAMRLLGQLAGALDFAAASGVHHGALHPRDILVAPHEVRLTGLGVVAALERVGFRAPARRPYTAPELTTGSPVSAAADVFSLACVAFELVTGRRPTLSGDGVIADTASIQAADPVALAEVFARALSPRPEDRYPMALAFAAALKHALTGDPLQAAVEPERPRPRRVAKRASKTPPLPIGPEADTIVASSRDVEAEPTLELASEPAPGSTPLPSFLEAYQTAVPEERPLEATLELRREPPQEIQPGATLAVPQGATWDAPQDAAPGGPPAVPADAPPDAGPDAFVSDFRDEPTIVIPKLPQPQPPAPEPSMLQPQVAREAEPDPFPEPLPLRLADPGTHGHDDEWAPAPGGGTAEVPEDDSSMFANALPATAARGEQPRAGLAALFGMLLVGILLGFGAGYLAAPRPDPTAPMSTGAPAAFPAPGTNRTPEQATPAPVPPGAAQTGPPAPIARPSGQPGAQTGAGAGSVSTAGPRTGTGSGRVTTDAPGVAGGSESPSARERRLAGVRARRDAARTPAAKGGAVTPAVGQKASPARPAGGFEGSLSIASKPAGASVMLDGRLVGTTPMSLPTMRAGSHVVRLELAGYSVWSSSVQVTAGTQNRVTASLERRPPG